MTVFPRSRSCRRVLSRRGVVALVEADRGLVEDVEDAHEARADLRRQTDALRLTAGERFGRTSKGQVLEADVVEETQSLANFLENRRRDLRIESGLAVIPNRNALEKSESVGNGQLNEILNVPAGESDRERFGLGVCVRRTWCTPAAACTPPARGGPNRNRSRRTGAGCWTEFVPADSGAVGALPALATSTI